MLLTVFLSLFKRYDTLTAVLAQAKIFEVEFKFVINFHRCILLQLQCFLQQLFLCSFLASISPWPSSWAQCKLLFIISWMCLPCHILCFSSHEAMTQVLHIHEYIILYQQLKLKCWFFLVLLWLWLLMITCVKFWNASCWCACLGAIAFNASFLLSHINCFIPISFFLLNKSLLNYVYSVVSVAIYLHSAGKIQR